MGRRLLENDRIQFNKRIFNNAKVSDHFAIIPTGRVVKLSDAEAKLYDMVVKRFIAVFFPHAEFEVTKRLTTIHHEDEKDVFLTNGKTLTYPGWLSVYGALPASPRARTSWSRSTRAKMPKPNPSRSKTRATNPPPATPSPPSSPPWKVRAS